MKLTDGLFHKIFDEIGTEYPDLEKEHWIVDIGAAKLADTPEAFDLIVMPNLYGDILSDVAAQITGSVGLAGSANIGDQCAMFEAIHGSAPRRAGQNLANPSGLLLAAVQMLVHIRQPEVAEKVHNAWLTTIEDGIHTYDIFREGVSKEKVGTKEFAEAIIARLGKKPQKLKAVSYNAEVPAIKISLKEYAPAKKQLMGVDVFLHWKKGTAEQLGQQIQGITSGSLSLSMITNRGIKVYPGGLPETFCTDHWRCRFMGKNDQEISYSEVIDLLSAVNNQGFDIIKTENLYWFDGKPAFSLGQGQ